MTREEAIKHLEDMKKGLFLWDMTELIDLCISALSENKGDLISRQAVIDVLTKTSGIRGDALKALYDLPSVENKGEWIPVTERLPEKNIPCLVAVGKFNLTQIAMYSDLMGTIDHRIFYQGDVGYDNFADITEYVNAWQPLPEPYKAEKGGE